MDKKFAELIATMEPKRMALIKMSPVTRNTLPKGMPVPGVYLLSEQGQHLYVGRSNRIRKRLGRHCQPSAGHNKASFAFLLAKKECGIGKATYKKDSSRKMQLREPKFKAAFDNAKERIRNMEVRFVEEIDPVKQALLEIYVATVLETPFNDFDTH
jgi:predicted GIY-YIG superfamily endonuclease